MRRNFKLLILALCLVSCDTIIDSGPSGEELLQQKCASCHQLPDPTDLSKDLWQQILPRMGARMGMYSAPLEQKHFQLLRVNNLLVEKPLMTQEEWDTLQKFIIENSPDKLPAFQTNIESDYLTWFEEKPVVISNDIPAASLISFHWSKPRIYYGDAARSRLYEYNILDDSGEFYQLNGAPSGIYFYPGDERFDVLTMGNIHPNDLNKGNVITFEEDQGLPIINGLSRPVHMAHGDLNADGQVDIVVSGFGYLTGRLSWFKKTADGYEEQILRNLPGALKTEILDLDNDGDLDLLTLMAQGAEGFYAYINDGQGSFREKTLYTFPASFGSSYFELADMNADGKPDIIYTNGDTGDYDKPTLKPYHGVRIMLQGDSLTFEESYNFPMHGPFKAMVEDYDLDGDMDIACISYFPDYKNTPEESFLMLVNNGGMSFNAQSIPGAVSGKWLTADRADYDMDGDIDIVLGNGPIMSLYVPDSLKEQWQNSPVSALILENTAIE